MAGKKKTTEDGKAPCLRLGEFLCANGTITEEELAEALQLQKETGRKLGAILVDMTLLTEEELCEELSVRLDIPYFDLEHYQIDPKVVQMAPEHICERYRLIPLKKSGKRLTVAMINPFDDMALEDLSILTGLEIRPVLATPSAISRTLASAFGAIDYAKSLVDSLQTSSGRIDLKKHLYNLLERHDATKSPGDSDEDDDS